MPTPANIGWTYDRWLGVRLHRKFIFCTSHDGEAGSILTIVVSGYRYWMSMEVSPSADPTSTKSLFGPTNLDGTMRDMDRQIFNLEYISC